MRLSEAIRLGSRMKPHAIHAFQSEAEGYCVIGTALFAVGVRDGYWWDAIGKIHELWPWTTQPADRALLLSDTCEDSLRSYPTWAARLHCLNCKLENRERIAQWVERWEAHYEAQGVNVEMVQEENVVQPTEGVMA